MELFSSQLLRESPGEDARAPSAAHLHGLGPSDKAPAVSPTRHCTIPADASAGWEGNGALPLLRMSVFFPRTF